VESLTGEELREKSFGELFKQLSEQTTTLVRQEVELAKVEMAEKGKRAGTGASLLGGGGLLGLGAFGALTAMLILVLAIWLDAWLACLIVTVVYAAGATVLVLSGKRRLQDASPLVPQQTIETLKEDVEWARTQR
jgi:uncharacterized membrane protein YqjE